MEVRSPAFRRQGIARAVMTELIRTSPYKRLSLSVDPNNPAANLYRSLGFETVGTVETSEAMVLEL